MKQSKVLLAATAVAGLMSLQVRADVTNYNANATAIFGSENPDTGWVSVIDLSDKLSLSLRAKNRTTGATPNDGVGTYSFPTGTAPSSSRALWNFEFSINAGVTNLLTHDYYLSITGPGMATTTLNALTGLPDDAYGIASTPNGGGLVGTAATYASVSSIAQNSENITFYGGDPSLNGLYDITLYDTATGAGADGARIDQASIFVAVGAVPEPSTIVLSGLGAAGFLFYRKRLKS